MKKKVVIIGSGISSLTLAILLLKAGHKVKILEQHYLPGGYLHCFERFGLKYETGGHYVGALGEGLPFQKLLKYLGVYNQEDFVALNPNQVDRYFFKDWSFAYGIGYKENIKRFINEFPAQSTEVKKYFELIQTSAHLFPTYYFKSEYDQSLMLKYLEMSLAQVFSLLGICGRLKEILQAPCVLHGVAPEDVSFGVHSILIDSIMVSSHGFSNGADRLAKRFVSKIEELGGEVLLRHRVTEIMTGDSQITGVRCQNKSFFDADEFVSGIHPKILFDLIGNDKLRPAFRNRILKTNESTPFIGAYLKLKYNAGIDPLSNYYFMPENAEKYFRTRDHSLENSFGFLASPLRTYETSGPFPVSIHASCSETSFAKWSEEQKKIKDPEYLLQKEKMLAPVWEKISLHFPSFSTAIEEKCYSSNLTNIRFNPSPNGSAYGIYHDLSNTGARALGPKTHFSNLYLTGQNTLFPGLLGASISGLRTAGFFVGIKGILDDLQAS
jgi:all-trans-retinol 13,14-reductase